MDVSCAGRVVGIVNDSGLPGGSPRYLATVDVGTGVVRNVGPTAPGMDASTWRTPHGFCRHTFVDADGDTVCDGLDCAPGDPSAFAVPGEVTFVAVQKVSPTHTHYTHTVAGGGSGTTHDAVLDLVTALPVGPGGGEGGACNYPGTVLLCEHVDMRVFSCFIKEFGELTV